MMQKKERSPLFRRRKIMIAILVVAGILTLGTFIMAVPMIVSGADQPVVIHIPKKATVQNVHDSLNKYLGESFTGKVMELLQIRKVNWGLRHGAYSVLKGESPYEVMRKISGGAQTPVKLVINGFRGLPVLTSRVSSKVDFTESAFGNALANPVNLQPYGLTPDQSLALFLNDTYEVYWSSSPKTVIDRIGKYYLDFWTAERREKAAALGLTPAQVAIVASIVDEETNAITEKGRVGRLYINRLQKGMKLQADPTVRFAIGDFTIKRVKGEHLRYDSPYNTYLYGGLPPGPIRTPSKSTIDAILDSKPTDELYMCAKEDFSGLHNFAVSYEEHLRNAKRYQDELDRRGIE